MNKLSLLFLLMLLCMLPVLSQAEGFNPQAPSIYKRGEQLPLAEIARRLVSMTGSFANPADMNIIFESVANGNSLLDVSLAKAHVDDALRNFIHTEYKYEVATPGTKK